MRRGTCPILTFHALDDVPDLCGFPAPVFRDGMTRLHAAGWRTIALADAVAAWKRGAGVPARTFVLTFDDGYRSVHREALPVLQSLGMTATIFLAVGDPDDPATRERLPTLNGRAMLGWSEIAELQRAGFAVGAHSLTHPDLTTLPPARVETEMLRARAVIEERLATRVAGCAYPYGRFDTRSRAIAAASFDFACADTFTLAGPASDPWALPRIETFYFRSPRRVGMLAHPWFPACVRAIGVARRVRRAGR